jgi:hypothetical protein
MQSRRSARGAPPDLARSGSTRSGAELANRKPGYQRNDAYAPLLSTQEAIEIVGVAREFWKQLSPARRPGEIISIATAALSNGAERNDFAVARLGGSGVIPAHPLLTQGAPR